MFVARINPIPEILMPQPGGGTKKFDVQCHQATCYWLYEEVFDHPPAPLEFTGKTLLNVQPFMGRMARLGSKLSPADFAKRDVGGGTILIFTDAAGDAKHSCVVRWDGSIGGYNQTNWFKMENGEEKGKDSEWSVHDPASIPWSADKHYPVKLKVGGNGNLIGVRGQTAVKYFRDNYEN